MKARSTAKFRVTPMNIRNGATAPYFIVEPEKKMKKDEVAEVASEQFKQRSALSKYSNWHLNIDKI